MRTLDECLKHTIASVNIQKINKIAFETISKYETPEGYSSMLREIQKEDPSIEKITIGNIFMDICQNVRDNDIGYISNDEGIVLQQALESVIISRTSKFTSEYPEIYLDIDGGGIINEDDVRISV